MYICIYIYIERERERYIYIYIDAHIYIYIYIYINVCTGARQYFSDTLKKVLQCGHSCQKLLRL